MTTETEITIPVETANVDTSSDTTPVDNTSDTVVDEQQVEETAVTETQDLTQEEPTKELLAGKYKTVDDLVKGYKHAESFISKANEFEKKYNDLVAKQQQEVQRLTEQKLQEAQLRGFQTVEQQEIADQVQVAEFEYYCNNLSQIDPEYARTVQRCLQSYYQSGHPSFLEEAKRYFPADFIERVAVAKSQLQEKLNGEYQMKRQQEADAKQYQLAQTLKASHSDFLSDLEQNSGKAKALQQFCEAGFVNTIEDMEAFIDVYNSIVNYAIEQHSKELEAQKIIDETKQKSVINTNPVTSVTGVPTYDEIKRMSDSQYAEAVEKYGLGTLLSAK